jgi:hypothetical protein
MQRGFLLLLIRVRVVRVQQFRAVIHCRADFVEITRSNELFEFA